MRTLLSIALLLMTATCTQAAPRDEIAGPIEARVLRVIDGDTLLVEARPWPQQKIEVYVRIRGIDTPEIRSKCPQIREAALSARRPCRNWRTGRRRSGLAVFPGISIS